MSACGDVKYATTHVPALVKHSVRCVPLLMGYRGTASMRPNKRSDLLPKVASKSWGAQCPLPRYNGTHTNEFSNCLLLNSR
eukprot:5690770-Amphidinium_carterae.2